MSLLLLFNRIKLTATDAATVTGIAAPNTSGVAVANAAYVANRGSGVVNSTFSLTWSFATVGAVASGNKVILAIRTSAGVTISSVSGGGLTWSVDTQQSNNGSNGGTIQIISADAPAGLAGGTTITVVDNSVGGDIFAVRLWNIEEWSGVATGAPASGDKASTFGTSAVPSSGATGLAATTGDAVFAATAYPALSVAGDWTQGTGYTKETTVTSNNLSLWTEYKVATAVTETGDFTTTLGGANWAAAVVIYPGVATAVGSENAQYVDAQTSTGTAVPSASDTAQFVDAATTTGTAVPSTADTAQYVDPQTATGVAVPSATDVAAYVDASTSTGTAAPNASDTAQDVDAATATGVAVPSASDTAQYVDANTSRGVAVPSTADTAQFVDSTICTTVAVPVNSDTAQFVDASTSTGVAVPVDSDTAQYVEATTVGYTGSIGGSNSVSLDTKYAYQVIIPSSVVVTGMQATLLKNALGTQDIRFGIYTDSGGSPNTLVGQTATTTITVSAPLFADITGAADFTTPVALSAGTYWFVVHGGATDARVFIEAGTGSGSALTNAADTFSDGLATTWSGGTPVTKRFLLQAILLVGATGIAVPSSSDTAQYVDAASSSGVAIPSASDTAQDVDATTSTGVAVPSASDTAQFVDAATTTGTGTCSATEVIPTDAATATGVAAPSASDTAQFVDASTSTGTAAASATDLASYLDSATATGVASPSATDVAAFVDASTSTGVAAPSASDTAQFVDAAKATGVAVPSATEVTPTDAATSTGTAVPSASDTAQYVDASAATGLANCSSTDVAADTEAATSTGVAVPSASDLASYVDANSGIGLAAASATDTAQFVDAGTVTGIAVPSASEVYGPNTGNNYVDAADVTGVADASSSEEYDPLDQQASSGAAGPFADDLAAFVDAAAVTGFSVPSADEFAALVESASALGISSPESNDSADYLDSATAAGVAAISALEDYIAFGADFATCTGHAYVISQEKYSGDRRRHETPIVLGRKGQINLRVASGVYLRVGS